MHRRIFVANAAALAAAGVANAAARAAAGVANAAARAAAGVAVGPGVTLPQTPRTQKLPFIKPRRLEASDAVALVAAAGATFDTMELDIAKDSLEALGLKVQIGGHLLHGHGYLPVRIATGRTTSTGSSPIRRSGRCSRSAAAGASAGCCRISTTNSFGETPKSSSGTATSHRSSSLSTREPD